MSDRGKCSVGKREPAREMGPGVERWSGEEAEPPQAGPGVENLSLKVPWEPAGGLVFPRCPPVDEFCLRDRKKNVARRRPANEGREGLLEEVGISSVRGGRNRDSEVVYVVDG